MTIEKVEHIISGVGRPLVFCRIRGARPGPVLALTGAVHGDEYEGPLVLSELIRSLDPAKLAGTLLIAPLCNPDAAAAGRRESPTDGKNLARVFPGRANGSPTEMMAALISSEVIGPADALVDLHSGGTTIACETFAGYADQPGGTGARSAALARAFGAPVVWRHPPPCAAGRTLSVAWERNIPAIYLEATGGPFPQDDVLALYLRGIMRAMVHLGHLEGENDPVKQVFLTGSGDLDHAIAAPAGGLVTAHVRPMQPLAAGERAFTITEPTGQIIAEPVAPVDGVAVFVRRARWVEKGELLMALAQPDVAG